MTSDFKLADALSIGFRSLTANPRIVLPNLALAVILPFMVFSAFPQASMRNFLALTLNSGTYLVDGSPLTILSIFLVAGLTIAAVLFACWQALLADSRDGMVGELMFGVVAALLSMVVAVVINVIWSVLASIALSALFGGLAGTSALMGPADAQGLGLYSLTVSLPFIMLLLWLNARLCLAGPAMAASGSINPFAGLAQSWRMTAPAQWRILFYLLAFQILGLALVVGVFTGTTALIIASDGSGWQDSGVTLAWLLTTLLLVALFVAVPLGLYRALRSEVNSEVFA
jgi:hypothetical protein